MEYSIRYNTSAFKHGFTESDIRQAIDTRVYDALLKGYENKYAAIGFDTAGNPLEIMYNYIDSETINVFHAMRFRPNLLRELNEN
jgi:hypothetical protein